jgi:uncharacterized protein (TIGR03086 family)
VGGSEELFALLSRAVDQAGMVIAGVRKDHAGLPTPCRSWDVGALIDHVINDLDQFTAAAVGGSPDWSAGAPVVADDWATAFRERAPGLLAAWRDADLTATVRLPIGDLPATFVMNQQIAEFAVHSWDLARATGQNCDLDPDVGRDALAWASTALLPEFRGEEDSGQVFGPEVSVAAHAPIYDRLAAYFGRNPA